MPTQEERNYYMEMARDLKAVMEKIATANDIILVVNRAKELVDQAICCTGLNKHGNHVFILNNSLRVDVINCDNIIRATAKERDRLNARGDELKARIRDIEKRTNINYR